MRSVCCSLPRFRSGLALLAWLPAVGLPCAAQGFRQQEFRPPEAPIPVVAQVTPRVTGNPFVRVWRAEDHDGGAACASAVQHPQSGFMYLANGEGVLEFDGAHWRLIPLPKKGAAGALAVDARGRVWVGASNEIARLEPHAHGGLVARTVVADLPDADFVYTGEALVASDGVWFGGLQHVLRVGPDDRVTTWQTAERFAGIWRMAGATHTSVSEREVVRLEENGSVTRILSRDSLGVPTRRPNALTVFAARDLGGGHWCLLTALGPVVWRGDPFGWRLMNPAMPFFREAIGIGATFLADGGFAYSLVRPGVALFAPDGSVERLVERMPGVLNDRFTHLAEDDEGGLWLPGRERIVRIDLRRRFSRHESPQILQGSPRQLVRAHGVLFVAHSEGVSRHMDWPGFFPPSVGLLRGADSLAVMDGRVFAAAGGLVEAFDDSRTQVWSNLGLKVLAGARHGGRGLYAGDAQGLLVFEPDGDGWREPFRVPQVRGSVESIFDPGDGWVWAATAGGQIWRADFRAGRNGETPVQVFGAAQGVPSPPPTERIKFFALGDSVVATCSAWMRRFDAAAGRFVPETRIAGVMHTEQLGAEAVTTNDENDARWLRLAPPDRRLVRLVSDGPDRWRAVELAGPILREFAATSLYEDRAQRTLWIAGPEGLVSADLDWRPAPAALPLVAHVRRVVAGNDVVWREAEPAGPLALDRRQTSLRFEYAAPLFGADHRGRSLVQFRTWLEGLEPGWTSWSAESRRDFTNLPFRAFTFRVQARDQTGRVSEERGLAFVIAAPWWLTRAMVFADVTAAALAILGIIKLRTRALQFRAARLEAVIAARTAELAEKNAALTAQNEELARLRKLDLDEKIALRLGEEKARLEVLRYQLNPHFLYNALNSIYGLVLTTPQAASAMVLRLADFCRAALTRHEADTTTVGAEFDKLALYLDIEKARWNDSLHVEYALENAARMVAIPPFLLQPLVENAIKYGGSTSPGDLRVKLAARVEPATTGGHVLVLEVANTGTWLAPAVARARGNTGLGLANLRQRLERSFPGAHEIATDVGGGWVVVSLRLTQKTETGGQRADRAVSASPPNNI